MHKLFVTLALFAAIATTAHAGPEEDAHAILAKWAKAFTDSDVDGIVSLYAADALFMGTGSKTVVNQTEGIRKYFENGLLNNRPRGARLVSHTTMLLADGAVLVTGIDNLTGVRDGKSRTTIGRVTFVVAKRGADWQIVHFHRSAMPN